MQTLRVILLLFMGLLLLCMGGCPGLYDSTRRMQASRNYYRTPNEITKQQLEEAKRLDNRDILRFEFVMTGALVLTAIGFVRAGRATGY